MKRVGLFLVLFLLLLCMLGCELVDYYGNPINRATQAVMHEWDDQILDPALQQAINGRTSCVLWRIPEDFRPEGIASVRPYTALDCAEIWPELKISVFPELCLCEETTKDGNREMKYSDGDKSVTVQVNHISVFIEGLQQKQAQAAIEKIRAYLQKKTGFDQEQWHGSAPEAQYVTYGMMLDEISLDVRMDSPMPVSCAFLQPNGKLILWNPILPGAPSESFVLEDCLTAEDLQGAVETDLEFGPPMVADLKECALIYYLDGDSSTLRPGWSLSGTSYNFDAGTVEPVEMIIDAINGKVKRRQ